MSITKEIIKKATVATGAAVASYIFIKGGKALIDEMIISIEELGIEVPLVGPTFRERQKRRSAECIKRNLRRRP